MLNQYQNISEIKEIMLWRSRVIALKQKYQDLGDRNSTILLR